MKKKAVLPYQISKRTKIRESKELRVRNYRMLIFNQKGRIFKKRRIMEEAKMKSIKTTVQDSKLLNYWGKGHLGKCSKS